MLKADVVLKGVYVVKVSGKLVRVRVDRVCEFGGWYGTNLATGREIRIRTAAKLRRPVLPQKGIEQSQAGIPPQQRA
jgi:hypothetical protein